MPIAKRIAEDIHKSFNGVPEVSWKYFYRKKTSHHITRAASVILLWVTELHERSEFFR